MRSGGGAKERQHLVEWDFPNDDDTITNDEVTNGDESAGDVNQIEAHSDRHAERTSRRSTRERHPPDYYGVKVNVASDLPKEPLTVEEAVASPDKGEWKTAMEKEMKSLKENEVWELVELREGRKAVGSKWVYKLKTCADGSIERYKARLVATMKHFVRWSGSSHFALSWHWLYNMV